MEKLFTCEVDATSTALCLDDEHEQCLISLLRRSVWACRSLDVVVWGNKENLFPCFTMRELGEDNYEKGEPYLT